MAAPTSAFTLHFSGIHKLHDVALGPYTTLVVSGNFMRTEATKQVIARYMRHQWQVGEHYYSSYKCGDQTLLHFEDYAGIWTEEFGPFKAMFVADGTMYVDEELFAKFVDESVLWHSYRLETWWPTLVIRAAPPQAQAPDKDSRPRR